MLEEITVENEADKPHERIKRNSSRRRRRIKTWGEKHSRKGKFNNASYETI
jgi:hypothetical protein